MMAMLSYRAPASVDDRFSRGVQGDNGVTIRKPSSHSDLGVLSHGNADASEALPFFAVESYLQYQGKKFIQRFDANCYIQLTHTLDSHDVARDRGTYEEVLRKLKHRTLVVGITSDVLYPFHLQTELAETMPHAEMYAIDSPHGHDAFLIEIRELNRAIARFRRGERADPNVARVAEGVANLKRTENENDPSRPSRAGLADVGALRGAVLALEAEVDKTAARAEREARRADALLAEVARLRDEVQAAKEAASGGGDGGGGGGGGAAAAATTGRGRRCLGTGFAFSRRTRRRTGGSSPCTGRSSRPLRARTRPWPRWGRFEGGGGRGRKGGGGERKRRSASRVMARTSQPTNPNLMSASVCRRGRR